MTRQDLKRIIEVNDTAIGRLVDLTIQLLIVVSLLTFAVETLPDLSEPVKFALNLLESVIVAVFVVEYSARLWAADHKLSFVFSFFGLIDLLAIVPYFLAGGLDLRYLRALRLFRLIRILKLVRYSRALRRFHRAFLLSKEEVVLFPNH